MAHSISTPPHPQLARDPSMIVTHCDDFPRSLLILLSLPFYEFSIHPFIDDRGRSRALLLALFHTNRHILYLCPFNPLIPLCRDSFHIACPLKATLYLICIPFPRDNVALPSKPPIFIPTMILSAEFSPPLLFLLFINNFFSLF